MTLPNVKRDYLFTIVFVGGLVSITIYDIIKDIKDGIPFDHWVHELVIASLSILFIFYKIYIAFIRDNKIKNMEDKITQQNSEINYYKERVKTFKHEFAEIIDNQFKIWGFTKSETDIALLIIKGLSMKEIAELRGSSEATVRQQSISIYKKSKTENRIQLSAYFLEDLF